MQNTPMSRQLDEAGVKLLNFYVSESLDAKHLGNLEDAKNSALSKFDYNDCPDWLNSLHESICEHMEGQVKEALADKVDVFRCMFTSYMNEIYFSYAMFAIMVDEEIPRLNGLIDKGIDINEPHLKWLVDMDKEFQLLIDGGAENHEDIFFYLKHAVNLDVEFDVYTEVMASKKINGITSGQYIEWYIRNNAEMAN
jgi:hypothetical protein